MKTIFECQKEIRILRRNNQHLVEALKEAAQILREKGYLYTADKMEQTATKNESNISSNGQRGFGAESSLDSPEHRGQVE